MSSAITITVTPDGKAVMRADLRKFEEPMQEALKRTYIFLGYITQLTAGQPLASASLNANIELNVGVPSPLPENDRERYQTDFRNWVIGQALMELDQSYQRYVVSAIEIKKDVEEFQKQGRTLEHKPNLANSWTVHEQFYASMSARTPEHIRESECLRSLANARNCLAHDSGIVSPRRLTDGDSMPIRWLGRDMFITRSGGDRQLLPRDRPHLVASEDVGQKLSVEEVERELRLREGDRISFSSTDLSEIIFFYQIIAMAVGAHLHKFVFKTIEELRSRTTLT